MQARSDGGLLLVQYKPIVIGCWLVCRQSANGFHCMHTHRAGCGEWDRKQRQRVRAQQMVAALHILERDVSAEICGERALHHGARNAGSSTLLHAHLE